MSLGPGKMDLMVFGWEKTAEAALFIEEVSKASGELQLLLNILSLVSETMDIFISLWVWRIILFVMDAHCDGGIHAFVISSLDSCDALCLKCLSRSTCRLPFVQGAVACFQVTPC